jgi:hypothetical protein
MTSDLSHKYGYFTVEHNMFCLAFIPSLSDRLNLTSSPA